MILSNELIWIFKISCCLGFSVIMIGFLCLLATGCQRLMGPLAKILEKGED